jgi:hypothetical protein
MIPLTPNDIDVLLHYYVSPEPHPRHNSPAVQSTVDTFIEDGILEEVNNEHHVTYKIRTTDRGRKFVEMICETPYPEKRWIDPREEQNDSRD